MEIRINGEIETLDRPVSLEELLTRLNLRKDTVVCELNRSIVKKNAYGNTLLNENDTLEIVHFVGGG